VKAFGRPAVTLRIVESWRAFLVLHVLSKASQRYSASSAPLRLLSLLGDLGFFSPSQLLSFLLPSLTSSLPTGLLSFFSRLSAFLIFVRFSRPCQRLSFTSRGFLVPDRALFPAFSVFRSMFSFFDWTMEITIRRVRLIHNIHA
jgi:hypothetical protein